MIETELIYQIIGWAGMFFLLLAFALFSLRKTKPRRIFYFLNFFGALGIAIYSTFSQNYVNLVISILWIIISIRVLVGILTPNKEYKDWTY